MFDVGFSELIVIGLVALIVIGPERLPGVARTVGHLLGRLQRYVNDVKSDINREMQLDELKKLQEQVTSQARDMERQVNDQMHSVETSLNASITQSMEDKSLTAADAGEPAVPQLATDRLDAVPPAPTLSAAPALIDKPAA
jgi:sec-independent protein translocase protein TatB